MCGTCGCQESTNIEMSAAPEVIDMQKRVMARNDSLAHDNWHWFAEREIFTLNLMSGPGAGKTTLLEETLRRAGESLKAYVIDGDQETSLDADRLREFGRPVIQINTGVGCHLNASMIQSAAAELSVDNGATLIIENVGNLVCPAMFALGEAARVTLLSVTEGEDKPLKYPHMFRSSELMVLHKVDLLPHLKFDVERCIQLARQVNPEIEVLQLSSTTGEGFSEWLQWLDSKRAIALKQMRSHGHQHVHHHGDSSHDHAHHHHERPQKEVR